MRLEGDDDDCVASGCLGCSRLVGSLVSRFLMMHDDGDVTFTRDSGRELMCHTIHSEQEIHSSSTAHDITIQGSYSLAFHALLSRHIPISSLDECTITDSRTLYVRLFAKNT